MKKERQKSFHQEIKNSGIFLNKNFAYIESLRNLLIDYKFLKRGEIIKRFRRVGNLKLLVIAGVFIKRREQQGGHFNCGGPSKAKCY